jgi:integrase
MESGLGWESANHLRNLMSKVFQMATKWNCHSGLNPAGAVSLPEKIPVREKHVLTAEQIPPLLLVLREPVRTMAVLGILTGMRVGEILGLRRKNVNFVSGQIKIE